MKQASFHDILQGFLEEEAPVSPLETAAKVSLAEVKPVNFQTWFHFTAPAAMKKNGYPAPAAPKGKNLPPVEEKAAEAKEPSVSVAELSATDRADVERLIRLGAEGLSERISVKKLKRAYRKLVKALHPDRLVGMSATQTEIHVAQFRAVQACYERLSRALPGYLSDSACESGSASGSNSPRRDAA